MLIERIEEFLQDLGYTVRPKVYSEEKEFLDEVMSMRGRFHGAKAALKKEKKPPLIPVPRSIKVGLIIGILLSFAGVVVSLTEDLVGQSLPLLSAIPSDIPVIGVPTWIPGALFTIILILSWYRRPFETLLTQELVVLFEGQLSKGTRVRSMEEKVQEMQSKFSPPLFFGTMIICYVVLALAMSLIIHATGINTVVGGAVLGFLVWIIVACVGLTGHISRDVATVGYLIDASYQLIYCVGTGALLGIWQ